MGLEHSFPERICQIRLILTLNFWLNSKKVHQCGYDSTGHASRGTGVIPDLGWSRYLRLLQSGLPRDRQERCENAL